MKWADAQKLAYSQGAGWIVSFGLLSHLFIDCLWYDYQVLELQD